ncbi:hypothetical protein HPB50_004541 [Hyalomma asiaticum]|uniref:Uncharacterized protein n=1 Tax=Hyalomma asiaticum TaxID=266040 RepID=A0ACB7RY96_HYAAI|nr:hypothetical protein HPB50_004541 [Hyalomma asiaticum]
MRVQARSSQRGAAISSDPCRMIDLESNGRQLQLVNRVRASTPYDHHIIHSMARGAQGDCGDASFLRSEKYPEPVVVVVDFQRQSGFPWRLVCPAWGQRRETEEAEEPCTAVVRPSATLGD